MKVSPPSLTPFLRSDVQGLLLAELLLNDDREFTITELAKLAGTSLPTAVREVDRLVASTFVLDRPVGRNRNIRANRNHALFRPMQEMITYAYGPKAVIEPLLARLPGLKSAFIFGSWAARLSGLPGPDPQDIDVLLIGSPDRKSMLKVAEQASTKLGREVNFQSQTPEIWADSTDPFIKTVQLKPLIELSVVAAKNGE
jgi:predicted nucleotidyltransferase